MSWKQYNYQNGGGYYTPLQMFFSLGLVFSFLIMMGSLMFSIYQYDMMMRQGVKYEYIVE